MEKNFIYVGHYYSDGDYILKVGTTNNLERRRKEHERRYKKEFVYDWYNEVSKYTALRTEDRTRNDWQNTLGGEFIRNDRFRLKEKPTEVRVTIRKEYAIAL